MNMNTLFEILPLKTQTIQKEALIKEGCSATVKKQIESNIL